MFANYHLFVIVLAICLPIEVRLSDSINILSSIDFLFDKLPRVRRDTNSSSPTENDIWNARLANWSNIIEKVSKTNISISMIGWQNVYDSSGQISLVNSIELAFPVREDAEIDEVVDDINRYDLHDRSSQHKVIRSFEVPNDLREQGVLLDVIIEAEDEHTSSPILLYWSPTTTFFRPDGLATLNKTESATKEEVQKFVKRIRSRGDSSTLKPLVLVYNEHGELKEDELKVPDFSVASYVVDSWQASDEILLQSPRIMAEVALTFKVEEVPEQLGRRFNDEFPKYDWRVLVQPRKFLLDNDVWVKLSTDGFEFYKGKKDIYLVYGIQI